MNVGAKHILSSCFTCMNWLDVPFRKLLLNKAIFHNELFLVTEVFGSRSQRPSRLRRRSAAARLLRLVGSNPNRRHGCLSVVSVVCCQVEVPATGWSLVRMSRWVWSRTHVNEGALAHWGLLRQTIIKKYMDTDNYYLFFSSLWDRRDERSWCKTRIFIFS